MLWLLFIVLVCGTIVGLDDVQREAASMLHAGSAQDRAKRTGSTALLPDNLADVCGCNLEPKHCCVLVENHVDLNGGGIIYQGLRDLTYERANLGDRV